MNSRHEDIKQLLPWYVNRTLSEQEHQMVEHHLSSCNSCQGDIREIDLLASSIQDLGTSQARLGDEEQIIHRAVQAATRPSIRLEGPAWWIALQKFFFPPLAALAVLLLMIQNLNPTPSVPEERAGIFEVARLNGLARSAQPSFSMLPNQPLLLEIANPDSDARYASYRCVLKTRGSSTPLHTIEVGDEAVFQLKFPSSTSIGEYSLEIFGLEGETSAQLAQFDFSLTKADAQSPDIHGK